METIIGFYIGREFKGEGKRKDGSVYQRYSLSFKPTIDTLKVFRMILFVPLRNSQYQLDTLQEGKQYSISFNIHQYISQTGIPAQSRTVVSIQDVGKDMPKPLAIYRAVNIPNSNIQGSQLSVSLDNINLDNFDEFVKLYMEILKKTNMKPNVTHMLGSYMAFYEPQRVKMLIERCKLACLTSAETDTVSKQL